MTLQEYIDQDLPFYHITPSSNLGKILREGLIAKRCNAICVVRSDNPDIWKEIINAQLAYTEPYYAVIKISPRKYQIEVSEIAPDSSEKERMGPLQNYIDRLCVKVDESDIVERQFHRGICPDWDNIHHLAVKLEGYVHAPIPDDSILTMLNNNG